MSILGMFKEDIEEIKELAMRKEVTASFFESFECKLSFTVDGESNGVKSFLDNLSNVGEDDFFVVTNSVSSLYHSTVSDVEMIYDAVCPLVSDGVLSVVKIGYCKIADA
ncbi:MAG: hypothetical protein GY861_21510 [bacterium]|nr:hypothetical protein [bacterium]